MNKTYIKALEKQVSLLQKAAKEMNESFMVQTNPLAIEDLETSMKAEISELKKAYDIEKANRLNALKELEATINKLDQTEMKLKEEKEARMKAEKEVSRLTGIISKWKQRLKAVPKVLKRAAVSPVKEEVKQDDHLLSVMDQIREMPPIPSAMDYVMEPVVQDKVEDPTPVAEKLQIIVKAEKNCESCPLLAECQARKVETKKGKVSFNKTSYIRKGCPALEAKRLTNGSLEVKYGRNTNGKSAYLVFKNGEMIGEMQASSKQNFDIRKIFESNAGKTVALETKTASDMVKNSIFTKLDVLSYSEVKEQQPVTTPASTTDGLLFDGLLEDAMDWSEQEDNNTTKEEVPAKKTSLFGERTPLFS